MFGRFLLGRKVQAIKRAIAARVKSDATEPFEVRYYGAYDIHPRHLTYWVCVQGDAERDRLAADQALASDLRALLVSHRYPAEGLAGVSIGFESQETVDRESSGNWWSHWK